MITACSRGGVEEREWVLGGGGRVGGMKGTELSICQKSANSN